MLRKVFKQMHKFNIKRQRFKLCIFSIIILFVGLVVIKSLYPTLRNEDTNESSFFNDFSKSIEPYLISEINGYTDIKNNYSNLSDDLYFSYYCLGTLKNLDEMSFLKVKKKSLEWFNKIKIKDIIDANNYDVISNIYYYYKLSNILEIQIGDSVEQKLINFILNSQNTLGYFYYSPQNDKAVVDLSEVMYDARINISTMYALELLKLTDTIVETNEYETLLKSYFNTFESEDDINNKLNLAFMYVTGSDYLYKEIPLDSKIILSEFLANILCIKSSEKTTLNDIYFYSNLLKISEVIGVNTPIEYTDFISNQTKMIEVMLNDQFHPKLLFHYTDLGNKMKIKISNKESIVNYVLERQNPLGNFTIEIGQYNYIVPTYFAFKTYEMLGSNKIDERINFFEESVWMRNSLTAYEKICLVGIGNVSNENNREYYDVIDDIVESIEYLDFSSKDSWYNYILVSFFIENLSTKDTIRLTKISDKILDYTLTRNTFTENNTTEIILSCSDLIIMKKLEVDSKMIKTREEEVVKTFNNFQPQIGKQEFYLLLSKVVNVLSESAISKLNVDWKSVIDEINLNKKDGIFYLPQWEETNMEIQSWLYKVLIISQNMK